jgi:hypothetical protein
MKDTIKGWTNLSNELWAKRVKGTRKYYAIRYMDLWEWMGERDCEQSDTPRHEYDLKLVDLDLMPSEAVSSALRCCGFKLGEGEDVGTIVQEYDGAQIASGQDACDLVIVDCCISYGNGAPLETFSGKSHPERLRAEAVRYAREMMRDDEALRARLSRVVNGVGSTAFEYGQGDISSGIARLGQPLVTTMKHGDLRKCPFVIFVPEHYREDGSCKCDDPTHQSKMVAEWGYDLADIHAALAAKSA